VTPHRHGKGETEMSESPWGNDQSGAGASASAGTDFIVTTTNGIDGRPVKQYLGVVTGEVIVGANLFRDLFASVRDIVGGRSGAYEDVLARAREQALGEMRGRAVQLGGNAVIGVDLDYEVLGANGSMLMVSATGTAVIA
jgi:uncharacterized protein YbjQ (UPF0145 family)